MARVAKIDNSLLKKIKQKKNREQRSYRSREVRVRYLIVCEGEKTEPNYFEAFKLKLPRGSVEVDIVGEGDNTLNVVKKVVELRDFAAKTAIGYDECWAVFDKDSFPNDRFNSAVFLARKEKIHCAYSNEAFELWYLLHFELYEHAMSRRDYSSLLSNHLKKAYQKNSSEMLELLSTLGDEDLAIQRAERLASIFAGNNPANENPVTYVHLLVKSLRKHVSD